MENIYTKTARFFVQNKELSGLLVGSILVAGVLAFIATPKQYNPEITLPAFVVTTTLQGVDAEEIERLVTAPIERIVAEIEGVDHVQSTSVSGGVSSVSVMFKIGTDVTKSKTALTESLRSRFTPPLSGSLPTVTQMDPELVPVLVLALRGGDAYPAEGLRTLASELREELQKVSGVTNIEILGGASPQYTVLLNPDALHALGVDAREVQDALRARNLYVPTGNIEGVEVERMLTLDARVTNVEQIEEIAIGGTATQPIRLRDVASVVPRSLAREAVRYEPKGDATGSVVYMSLAKVKGANIGNVTNAAHEHIVELQARGVIPSDVEVRTVRDEGKTANDEVFMLTEHLFAAIVIVVVTLVFFIGTRAALVVAIAIPVTLALVFILGYFFDQSINRITLFALIFSLGLLVDDAIVVIENIYRHFTKREVVAEEAIVRATGEVGSGVFLATITAVVVFLPMGMVTGMMGAYMAPIAFFAPVARLASMFVAYVISPYNAAVYLAPHAAKIAAHEHAEPKFVLWYRHLMHRILRSDKLQKRILWGSAAFVLLAFSLPVLEWVHFRMLPKADRDYFAVYIDMPQGTPFAKTDARAVAVSDTLKALPDVAAIEVAVGVPPVNDFTGMFRGAAARSGAHQATLKVDLVQDGERTQKSEDVVVDARALLAETFGDERDVELALVEDPPGPPVLATLLARVKGGTAEGRETIAQDLAAQFRLTDGVVDVGTTLPSAQSSVHLSLDSERLARAGLTAADVAQVLAMLGSGTQVGMLHNTGAEFVPIVVQFALGARDEATDLSRVHVENAAGAMVPLLSLTDPKTAEPDSARARHDGENVVMVTGETEGRAVVYAVKDLIRELLEYRLPSGEGTLDDWGLYALHYTDSDGEVYTIEWGGEFELTLDAFRDLGKAMLVAYALIYAILVAQFKSYRSALLIMSSIVLAFAGVLPGFALLDYFGVYFSATSMIGMIALGGIVVGNAILLLDFIVHLREKGQLLEHAIIEACGVRLRPILLTALTGVLGSLIIVLDPVWSGLAWAIVFGLTLSTLLTLVIFPVLYFRFGE